MKIRTSFVSNSSSSSYLVWGKPMLAKEYCDNAQKLLKIKSSEMLKKLNAAIKKDDLDLLDDWCNWYSTIHINETRKHFFWAVKPDSYFNKKQLAGICLMTDVTPDQLLEEIKYLQELLNYSNIKTTDWKLYVYIEEAP